MIYLFINCRILSILYKYSYITIWYLFLEFIVIVKEFSILRFNIWIEGICFRYREIFN